MVEPASSSAPAAPFARARRPWIRRILLAGAAPIVLLLSAILVGIPAVLSSDAAAKTASELLTQRFGVPVAVGDLEFGWGSGLAVRDVKISSHPGFGDTPFFSVSALAVRPRVLSLFSGRFTIDEVAIVGPTIHVERREDGSMNLPTLGSETPPVGAATAPAPPAAAPAFPIPPGPPIEIGIRRIVLSDAAFTLNDRSLGAPLEVRGLGFEGSAEATARRMRCELKDIRGQVNGGTLTGAVTLQDGADGAELAAAVEARDVKLGVELTHLLKVFVPLIASVPTGSALEGKIGLAFEASGKAKTAAELLPAITGKASVGIRDLSFTGSALLRELSGVLRRPELARYTCREYKVTTTIEGGKFHNNLAEIAGEVPFTAGGTVDFGMNLDYRLEIDPKAVTSDARIVKAIEAINGEGGLRVTGPVSDPEVHFDFERVLKEGAKAYLKEAVKEKLGEALRERGVTPPEGGEGGAKGTIEKGIEGLLRRKKK